MRNNKFIAIGKKKKKSKNLEIERDPGDLPDPAFEPGSPTFVGRHFTL